MILDNYLDNKIGAKIKEDNEQKRLEHKSSGKLSASMLGMPLQWQILKILKVPEREIDEYTLRKFLRGTQIEDWLVAHLDYEDKQLLVEYRGAIGYVDAICNTDSWENKKGTIPVEVKSVSNAKFKRILKQGADRSHKLQAGLYALGLKTDFYAIAYVATDDLRVHTFIYPTAEVKPEIDKIIDRFEAQMNLKVVPKFVAEEDWQANAKYNKYPSWSTAEETEFINIK